MVTSYAPDLPPEVLAAERGWLQGAILGGVGYGANIVLFFVCFQFLFPQVRAQSRTIFSTILFSYICLNFFFVTVFMGSLAKFTEMAFIDNRMFPGGPSVYENEMFSVPQSAMGNVAFVLGNWLSDAILVWRYWVIFRGSRFPVWLVMTIPCAAYLGVFALGILWAKQICTTSPYHATSPNWTAPYLGTSLGLNMFATLAIVGRLLLIRSRIDKVLGSSFTAHYTPMAAILIESSMLYSIFALLFLIPFALNHPISTIFLQSLTQVQTAASFLIVFRVAKGQEWSTRPLEGRAVSSRSAATGFPLTVVSFTDDESRFSTFTGHERDIRRTVERGDESRKSTEQV